MTSTGGSARWLLSLTIVLVVVAACEPDGQLGEETAASLTIPAGIQQMWCAGQGPGVVFINGIGNQASSRQWLDVQGQLAEDAHVCRYDRPGTGDSPPPTLAGRGPEALVLEGGGRRSQSGSKCSLRSGEATGTHPTWKGR